MSLTFQWDECLAFSMAEAGGVYAVLLLVLLFMPPPADEERS
jgi:hypothetical protein